VGALIDAGLEGFVRNASAELPRGLRINLISPGWIRETLFRLATYAAQAHRSRKRPMPTRMPSMVWHSAHELLSGGRTFRF